MTTLRRILVPLLAAAVLASLSIGSVVADEPETRPNLAERRAALLERGAERCDQLEGTAAERCHAFLRHLTARLDAMAERRDFFASLRDMDPAERRAALAERAAARRAQFRATLAERCAQLDGTAAERCEAMLERAEAGPQRRPHRTDDRQPFRFAPERPARNDQAGA